MFVINKVLMREGTGDNFAHSLRNPVPNHYLISASDGGNYFPDKNSSF